MNKEIPHDRLLRINEVLQILPVSRSAWWNGVREGRFPQPIKLGPRTTCWRYSEIMKLVSADSIDNGEAA